MTRCMRKPIWLCCEACNLIQEWVRFFFSSNIWARVESLEKGDELIALKININLVEYSQRSFMSIFKVYLLPSYGLRILDSESMVTNYSLHNVAAAAKSLQSCPTLCDHIDSSPPSPTIPGILQARTLEWVAISSSNAWKWKVKVKLSSRARLLATPWTAAHQAPPSMGPSSQEYWSELPLLLTVNYLY